MMESLILEEEDMTKDMRNLFRLKNELFKKSFLNHSKLDIKITQN